MKAKAQKSKKKPMSKVVTTMARSLPISPRKLRLVAAAFKNKTPEEALTLLPFVNKKGARFLYKAVRTAIADAEHNFHLNKSSLRFEKILVNEGTRLKRMDKSHSARFHQGLIQKRRSHLIVSLKGVKKDGAKS